MMDAATEAPYFVKDFLHVIETVTAQYGAEFSDFEKDFVGMLGKMSPQALCLYIRLVNRSKNYYSVGKLRYAECEPLNDAVAELIGLKLVELLTASSSNVCEVIGECYTLAELSPLRTPYQPKLKVKADYISRLIACENKEWLIEQLLSANPIIAPIHEPWRFLAYLYFGEITPNLSAFVIKELGHLTPETIEPARYERAFVSRLHAEIKYRHAHCYQQFRRIRAERTALELYQWWKGLGLPAPIDNTTSQPHDYMVGKMGQLLAKSQNFDLAITTYRQCVSEDCALPLAKLLRKRGLKDEALTVCERLLNSTDPEIVQQGNLLRQRLAGKRARSKCHEVLVDEPVIALKATSNCVEYAALHHLRQEGWLGIHSENWLWSAFFGLSLWPVIYDASYGGFSNSLQLAPADMWQPEFYDKRAEAIETRIKSFDSKDALLEGINKTLTEKKDVTNPFFRWQDDLATHLSRLCTRLPLSGLKATLRRMSQDPGQFLRGFPDLFVWRSDAEYSFIEVKSLNDKLSAHQLAWINTFNAFGITTKILRVDYVRTIREPRDSREAGRSIPSAEVECSV